MMEAEPTVASGTRVQGAAAFPIVGIGGSAGGLSAFQGFLSVMPGVVRWLFST